MSKFITDWNEVKASEEQIRWLEKKLNERGFLFASELGIPMSDRFGCAWSSNGAWDPDYKWEIHEVLDDGTVLMDWNPVSDNTMRILTLESKLERHFMDLEERIENCWV